jgi:hypothetical protein
VFGRTVLKSGGGERPPAEVYANMRLEKVEDVNLRGKGGMRASSGLPQLVAVLLWDIKPWDCFPSEGCKEAPAHPGDVSEVKPKPFMGVALKSIGLTWTE